MRDLPGTGSSKNDELENGHMGDTGICGLGLVAEGSLTLAHEGLLTAEINKFTVQVRDALGEMIELGLVTRINDITLANHKVDFELDVFFGPPTIDQGAVADAVLAAVLSDKLVVTEGPEFLVENTVAVIEKLVDGHFNSQGVVANPVFGGLFQLPRAVRLGEHHVSPQIKIETPGLLITSNIKMHGTCLHKESSKTQKGCEIHTFK